MIKMTKKAAGAWVLAVASALAPSLALAWGSDGHAIVGALADRLIEGSHAQTEVEALLLPGESLEQAANWLDCAKGTSCGPPTPEMIAYTLANPRHGHYHYTDIPFQRAHYRDGMVGAAADDIVHTLKQAIKVLQNMDKDSEDEALNPHHFTPRQALMLVAHLVGDIHQPLHVGAAYVDRNGAWRMPAARADVDGETLFDTRGGNNFLLDEATLALSSARLIPAGAGRASSGAVPVSAAGRPVKRSFHAYWDINAVDYAMRRFQAVTPAQFAEGARADLPALPWGYPGHRGDAGSDPLNWPAQWADDGLRVAKLAYAGVRPGRHGAQVGRYGEVVDVWMLTLPPDYPLISAMLARQQLAKAGYRLAALLQSIWP
jgi:hypothetical protein